MVGIVILLFPDLSVGADLSKRTTNETEAPLYSTYPWLRDFELNEYGPSGLIAHLQADSMKVDRRKIWFFHIKSINEVNIDNAQIRVNLKPTENTSDESSILGMGSVSPSTLSNRSSAKKNMGIITRTYIDGVSICIGPRGSSDMCLTADSAEIEGSGLTPKFRNATLKSLGGKKRLFSSKILWDAEQQLFLIPGEYVARSSDQIMSGSAVKVNMDFDITPL